MLIKLNPFRRPTRTKSRGAYRLMVHPYGDRPEIATTNVCGLNQLLVALREGARDFRFNIIVANDFRACETIVLVARS